MSINNQLETFVIEVNGEAVHILQNGQPVSLEAYERINHLIRISYRQLKHRVLSAQADSWSRTTTWIFPAYQKQLRASGNCVYIIRCDAFPGLVKIGHTSSLLRRISHLKGQYKSDVQVLAFTKTPDKLAFEQALHARFRKCRVKGEWFAEAPVIEFLLRIRDTPR